MKSINNKKFLFAILPLIAVIGIFLFGHNVLAAPDWAVSVISGILGVFIWALGVILVLVIKGLIIIAQYQDFIGSDAVRLGWVIVRDICNMFFVVVLLIIAFGTILHLENYSYKKWLPKLILMAVLINFSKTICGLMIDAAQVVMLTFVNAFKDVGGANLTDILGLSNIVTMAKDDSSMSLWTVVGAYVLGIIYLLVAVVVIVTMMMMLVMRLVMIWIYVVLSPAAYLLSAFPGGQKYASQWWSEFTKNLVVGPVLAFFIWLSFAALQTYTQDTSVNTKVAAEMSAIGDTTASGTNAMVATKASSPASLIQFVIAIGMLLGGLKISQEIGGAAGSMAGKGMSKISSGASFATGKITGAGKGLGKWTGRQLGDLRDMTSEKLGVDLNLAAGERRRREQVEHNRALRQTRIRKGTLKQAEEGETWIGRKAALLSTGDVAWQNIMDRKFNAGSPAKNKEYLGKIKAQEDMKKAATGELGRIDLESGKVVTAAEDRDNKERIKDINKKNYKLEEDSKAIVDSADYKKLLGKEKAGSLTEDETKELVKKKADIKKINDTMARNLEEKDVLSGKNIVVSDKIAKDAKLEEYQKEKDKSLGAVNAADAEIAKFADVLRKNQLSEVQSARASISAKMEGEASKQIANFSNPDQLVGIFKEAEEQHDEGLMAACYKKLAKSGNYNDLHRSLGIGTGYDGMIKMSEHLQKAGGMTEQDSRALIAEVGELAKASNHFEAFGAMSMNKAGKWEETGKDEQEAAILSEKSKVQVQQFVRSVNRLGAGSYRNGEPHDSKHWDISRSTISLFASKDAAYAADLEKTGNINVIRFIGANEKNLEALEKNGAVEVAKVIRKICAQGGKKNDVSNPMGAIRGVVS
ncbi:MAG: hypothetical protein WC719_03860 [Patescibacteria group bacterium]|jgi:hypothetical protein